MWLITLYDLDFRQLSISFTSGVSHSQIRQHFPFGLSYTPHVSCVILRYTNTFDPSTTFRPTEAGVRPLGLTCCFEFAMVTYVWLVYFLLIIFLINIYFQEAFSQSDFQKGPEQIYKEDMHILHNYEKYFKSYTRESSKIAKKVSPKYRNTTRQFYLSVQAVSVCYGLISESLLSPIPWHFRWP
jgi:hypothetical protein